MRFVPHRPGVRASIAALAIVGACLAGGCNAGRIRQEVGDQVRAIADRLRGASARDRYADALRRDGPDGDALARGWLAAGDRALGAPVATALPSRAQGVVPGDEPTALAWRARPRRGERVTVRVDAEADSGVRVFGELWEEERGDPSARRLVASGESAHAVYDAVVDDPAAVYVLRLQPEVHRRVRWRVAFGAGPSLAFPVAGKDARAIESGWGAARDGGARAHEGVDIMARRGTPALAAEDGVVSFVGDDRLGGRVVSIVSAARGHSLYYAHLDAQAVHAGQAVRTGDTVGFVGNTGNARGGPTHLHFGVYTAEGAVDPLPYLDDRRRGDRGPAGQGLAATRRAVSAFAFSRFSVSNLTLSLGVG